MGDATPRQDPLQDAVLRRVLGVARELSGSTDLRQILSVVIDAMRDLLDADRATIFELDAERSELFSTVAHGLTTGETAPTEIRFPMHAGLAGESARTQRILNVPNAHEHPLFNPEVDRKTGYQTKSLLTIPLIGFDGELIGVAQVLNKSSGLFDVRDEQLAEMLASQAAVAIRRGRLLEDRLMRQRLERDLSVARVIQRSSLPSVVPAFAGFELEGWNRSADQTGGDAYDMIGLSLEDGELSVVDRNDGRADRVILLMADATGHGIGPALSVTQVRSMLRMAARVKLDLGRIALHVNRQLCEDLPTGMFVTTWLGQLEPPDKLTSFSAGQGPLLLYRYERDDFEVWPADTAPFGVMLHLPIEVKRRTTLAPGDIFLAISDGVFEAADASDEQYGVERTKSVVREMRDASARELVETLRHSVDAHAVGPRQDDQTVVVVRRLISG